MPPWLPIVIALCLVAVTAALVPAILALKRVADRAERVLAIVESDLRPTIERGQGVLDEAQGLLREVTVEVGRVGDLARRATDFALGGVRVLTGLAGLTRAGQVVGIAAGMKAGWDVFLRRLRRS